MKADFSISRDKKRFSWGVPILGDDNQVMYVWFDAFVNYISTLGWPENKEQFKKYWVNGKKVQTAGKDMVKFQSLIKILYFLKMNKWKWSPDNLKKQGEKV